MGPEKDAATGIPSNGIKRRVHAHRTSTDVASLIADSAKAFTDVDSADIAPMLDRIGEARGVSD